MLRNSRDIIKRLEQDGFVLVHIVDRTISSDMPTVAS